jgi:hypothetical protein
MLESVFHKDPIYDDLPAEAKDFKMLEYLVLLGASGKHVHIKGFNDREINHCARKLIDKGYLRGTVLDADHSSWNRTTQKGIFKMEILAEELHVT